MTARDIENLLLEGAPTVRQLYTMWELRRPDDPARIPWLEDVRLAQRFASLAMQKEEYLLVFDAAREILRRWGNAGEADRTRLIHVRMDYASVLARLGLTREARGQLEQCLSPECQLELGRSRLKGDILLQLGDVLREEWFYSTERATQVQAAMDALNFYNRAFELDRERLEALVRTASACLILERLGENRGQQAKETAHRILRLTKDLFDSEGPRRRTTWAEATAHAVLGEREEAARSFEQLGKMPGITTSELATARFEAQFLAEALGESRDFFQAAFPPLQLIVFAGHLPDKFGSRVRFPPESVP
jgi:tetratricopeptide (TPR) repeat protein